MAFGAKRIFPIDQKPGTAVGISIPFNAPGVFFSTYTTKDAIRNNLLNFFLTNKTERYLNNQFGVNLRAFIFEQMNVEAIREMIGNVKTMTRDEILQKLEIANEGFEQAYVALA